jgi:3-deoxy-7-phosphoheptulonate synthase
LFGSGHHFQKNKKILKVVKGFMFESFIKEGNQKINPNEPEKLDRGGLSISDACLSWEQTEKILTELAKFKKSFNKK